MRPFAVATWTVSPGRARWSLKKAPTPCLALSMWRMAKENLPTDIYSVRGRPRLVLVTCGGRFDQAAGHYVDNVVVTAVPLASG